MEIEQVQLEVCKIIENLIDSKVNNEDSLIESRLIDSMGVIDLTMELEEFFKIKIQAAEVKPENFETVQTLSKFILSKK